MRSLLGPARRGPKFLPALLGLSLLLPVMSLAAPAHADPEPTTLTVEVVDANGDEIEGAAVELSGDGTTSKDTVADGTVTFELDSGLNYQLSFSKTRFVTASLPAADGEGPATITVTPEETILVDGEAAENNTVQMKLDSDTDRVLTGQVLGAGGAPLAGIAVKAVDQEDRPYISPVSNADGTFSLPVRIGTYDLTYLGAVVGNYTYVNTAYTGIPAEVVVSQTTSPALAAQAMTVDDGSTKFDLKGTVSDWDGEALTGVTVSVLPIGREPVVATDTSRTIDGEEGAYRIGVRPGTYRLRFDLAGYQSAFLENGVDEGPVNVTVSATGSVSAPEIDLNTDGSLPDVTLLLLPAAVVKAPKLTGAAVAGQTLTLSPGTWQGINVDTDYVFVEWFIGGKPADDYSAGAWSQKFDVPVEAVGKKIGFKITVDDPEGAHAPSVYEGSTGVVPKAAARIKGAFKKGKLLVTLTVAGQPKPTGSFLVKDGKKTLLTVKLKARSKGKTAVKLPKLKPGKHKLTLVYAGSQSIKAAKSTVKFKS